MERCSPSPFWESPRCASASPEIKRSHERPTSLMMNSTGAEITSGEVPLPPARQQKNGSLSVLSPDPVFRRGSRPLPCPGRPSPLGCLPWRLGRCCLPRCSFPGPAGRSNPLLLSDCAGSERSSNHASGGPAPLADSHQSRASTSMAEEPSPAGIAPARLRNSHLDRRHTDRSESDRYRRVRPPRRSAIRADGRCSR